ARASDLSARIGGDEFAVLLPETSHAGAVALAEKVRLAIEQAGREHARTGTEGWPTISCGVTTSGPELADAQEMVDLTDRCLYRAKQSGGNAVFSQADLENGPPA
ncbi:MAG TPA: GGDEF domain-containing protein, partial [Acidobacteria bacterium]|nr:GGDEF domain-containing protein [Acidobacteriota bacterium]